jgi:hypothetical protein
MKRLALFLAVVSSALLGLVSVAAAAPVLDAESNSNTSAAPGAQHVYYVSVANAGDEATSASFTLQASLPPGVEALSTTGFKWDCSGTTFGVLGGTVNCSREPLGAFGTGPSKTTLILTTHVDAAASGTETAHFSVWGEGNVVRADGSPCGTAPPQTPCDSSVDPTLIDADPLGFGVDAFDAQPLNGDGSASTVAGGHPEAIATTISFNTYANPTPNAGDTFPVEPTKDVVVDLPPGFIGYPTATGEALCTLAQLSNSEITIPRPLCPSASQVGIARIVVAGGVRLTASLPIFNVVAPPGVPARFGFNVQGSIITLDGSLRSGSDYGLTVSSRGLPGLALASTTITFWGVPGDPSHDARRACPGEREPAIGGPHYGSPECPGAPIPDPPAFLRNPTSCQGPQATGLAIDSWTNPGALAPGGRPNFSDPNWETASFLTHESPGYPFSPSEWGAEVGMSGCEDVPFEPTITAQPTTNAADSPSGLDVSIKLPQSMDPESIATADLKKAVVTLPEGMAVNPSSAAGLGACSLAQIDLHGDNTDPTCPDSSKIGSVEIASPVLADPLEGSVYLAKPSENPFGSLLALYLTAKGPGVVIKLAGEVRANAQTGQLETVFDDNPQLPFSELAVHLKSGPRAPLITPKTCGTFTTQAKFSSWAQPGLAEARANSFAITSGPNGSPCPASAAARPLGPQLSAGLIDPTAGSRSPFVFKLTRADGEQELSGLSVDTPPGLSAYLRGVPYCPPSALQLAAAKSAATELAAPSCPPASQLGSLDVGAGALPFHVNTGKVYLSGPYKAAPLSLAVVVPALAGPFDLGTVVVRAAINVDPTDARLHVVSDPLPTILAGIPLQVRQLAITLDRPAFMLAPTNCEPMAIAATLGGLSGATANPSVRFQVGGCERLAFKPKLDLKLSGATKRAGYPALRATLRMPKAGANLAATTVALPHSEFLAQEHIKTICTRVQFAAASCPPGSIYGHARAFTPLLDKPLEGPVYLRSSANPLPDLVADLNGQIHVVLAGAIDSHNKGIRTTFASVPDAPVSKFVLTMAGGKKGLLVNSRNICARAYRAAATFTAQSGKAAEASPLLRSDCAKAKKRHHKKH